MALTFEAYRRLTLKELTKVKTYKNFHICVKAFSDAGGLDDFARSLLPLMRACWKEKWDIPAAAVKINELTKASMMAGMLYNAEVKQDKRRS